MADFNSLNQNPELAAWLDSLKKSVAEKVSKSTQTSNEPRIFLPKINLGRKFSQKNGKVYPEMQGSISFLLVPNGTQRVTEISKVFEMWCPTDKEWNSGYTFRLLQPNFYPEGPIRDKVIELRRRVDELLNTKLIDWKMIKIKNYSLIKAFVLMHRNLNGDIIFSNLYGGEQLVEHKHVPALLIAPNNGVQSAIQDDLSKKMNPVPYALSCYSNEPLKDRKGWISMTFKDKAKGFGYEVSVGTDLLNPIIQPEGIVPATVNFEDERIKLLDSCDPIYTLLDRHQVGPNGEYWNEGSLQLLEDYINWMKDNKCKTE